MKSNVFSRYKGIFVAAFLTGILAGVAALASTSPSWLGAVIGDTLSVSHKTVNVTFVAGSVAPVNVIDPTTDNVPNPTATFIEGIEVLTPPWYGTFSPAPTDPWVIEYTMPPEFAGTGDSFTAEANVTVFDGADGTIQTVNVKLIVSLPTEPPVLSVEGPYYVNVGESYPLFIGTDEPLNEPITVSYTPNPAIKIYQGDCTTEPRVELPVDFIIPETPYYSCVEGVESTSDEEQTVVFTPHSSQNSTEYKFIVVAPQPVPAEITVAANPSTISCGQSTSLVANVRDAQGEAVPNTPVTFSDGPIGGTFIPTVPVVATNSQGEATVTYTPPYTAGPITITASAGTGTHEVSGAATVTCTPELAKLLVVDQDKQTFEVPMITTAGTPSQKFKIVLADANNNIITDPGNIEVFLESSSETAKFVVEDGSEHNTITFTIPAGSEGGPFIRLIDTTKQIVEIKAKVPSNPAVLPGTAKIKVIGGEPYELKFTGPTGNIVEYTETDAGVPTEPLRVTLYDAYNNTTEAEEDIQIRLFTSALSGNPHFIDEDDNIVDETTIKAGESSSSPVRFVTVDADLPEIGAAVTDPNSNVYPAGAEIFVKPLGGSHYTWAVPGINTTAGEPATNEIRIKDLYGNDAELPFGTYITIDTSGMDIFINDEETNVKFLPAGTSTVEIKVKSNIAGTYPVTASSEGITPDTMVVTVNPGAPSVIAIQPNTATVEVNAPVTLTVRVKDVLGNTIRVSEDTELTVNTASTSGKILVNNVETGKIVILAGEDNTTFEYRNNVAGEDEVTVTGTGLTPAVAVIKVVIPPENACTVSTTSVVANPKTSSKPIVVKNSADLEKAQDQDGNIVIQGKDFSDINIVTDYSVEIASSATINGNVSVKAATITVGGTVKGNITVEANDITIRPSAKIDGAIKAEASGTITFNGKGKVGDVALCGSEAVTFGPSSDIERAETVFVKAKTIGLPGKVEDADKITIEADKIVVGPSAQIGTKPNKAADIIFDTVTLDMSGRVHASGKANVTTETFKLNPSHQFNVTGECTITGTPLAGSVSLKGMCTPGIQ